MYGMTFISFELGEIQAFLFVFVFKLLKDIEMIVDSQKSWKIVQKYSLFTFHQTSSNVNIPLMLHKHGTFINIKKLIW